MLLLLLLVSPFVSFPYVVFSRTVRQKSTAYKSTWRNIKLSAVSTTFATLFASFAMRANVVVVPVVDVDADCAAVAVAFAKRSRSKSSAYTKYL